MEKTKIPWSNEEESRMVELREQGCDWDHIAETLNSEFKDLRPINDETGKRYRRTGESIMWHDQNVKKKMKKTNGVSTNGEQKPKPVRRSVRKTAPLSPPLPTSPFTIEIKDENDEGKTVLLMRIDSNIKTITNTLKELM